MSDEPKGHTAYIVWLIFHFRAIEKILPALKGKGKYGWAAPAFLCLLVLLTSIGVGIYIDGYVIHPPQQYTGICPAPAQIKGQSCYTVVYITEQVSGTQSIITQTQQAGTILTTSITIGNRTG